MNYLVMETHFSYAIVLSENGRFIKCANLNYEVGQKVRDIYAMQEVEAPAKQSFTEKIRQYFWIPTFAAAFALILFVLGVYQNASTFAYVYMSINPEVRIEINQRERVIGMEAMNSDGEALIENYSYKKKELNRVMNELIDRAIDMNFLSEGGKVSIDLDTEDTQWQQEKGSEVKSSIQSHLKDKVKIIIEIDGRTTEDQKIILPIEPTPPPTHESEYGDSNYDDSDYGDSDYGSLSAPSYDDSPYDDFDDSGYDDSDYDSSEYDD